MTSAPQIVAVNFTYAMTGGMWIETAAGSKTWLSAAIGVRDYGQAEWSRLCAIAHRSGLTGMWYNATTGENCFVNGQRVA